MNQFIYIETYGCSANQNNSEILSGILMQSGYQLTNNEKIADIIIINTCIVKGKTEQKIKRRIQNLSRLYKSKLIIIAGCMPETDFNSLKKINPKLIFLGTHHFTEVIKLIKDFNENQLTSKEQLNYLSKRNEEKILLSKISQNKLISIIQISEGCLGDCTYCKTKLAKGKLFSYEKEKIIKQIESDLQAGAKEIWITSQDNASYGLDKEGKKPMLPELLNEILKLKHNFKLRLGMMNPNNLFPILEQLIQIYNNKKMYKFIHIPIQSTSNQILKDMNRNYNIEKVEEIINKFKKEIPNITIATDIITGYPTETEKDNEKNLDFIQNFKPDVLNLSKFSSHKSTEAGKLSPLSKEIINKRATELMQLHRKTAEENKQKFRNKTLNVFINKKISENLYESRDDNYNIVLITSKDKSILGKNINIKIKNMGVHHMIGEIPNLY
jgi:threonylcarbamoyladenosine tRNA methylthiotransferase CDKAL1